MQSQNHCHSCIFYTFNSLNFTHFLLKIHPKPLSHKAFHDTRLSIHLSQPVQSSKNPCHINIFIHFTHPLTITNFPPHDKQKRVDNRLLFYNSFKLFSTYPLKMYFSANFQFFSSHNSMSLLVSKSLASSSLVSPPYTTNSHSIGIYVPYPQSQ